MVDHDTIGWHKKKLEIRGQVIGKHTTYLEIYLHILPFTSRYSPLAYVVKRWHSMNGIRIESHDLMVACESNHSPVIQNL